MKKPASLLPRIGIGLILLAVAVGYKYSGLRWQGDSPNVRYYIYYNVQSHWPM